MSFFHHHHAPRRPPTLLLVIFCVLSILAALCVEASGDDEEDDDEQPWSPQQLVIFAVDGLKGSSSTQRFMPFTHDAALSKGVYTPKARALASHSSIPAWIEVLYSATPEQYGCDPLFSGTAAAGSSSYEKQLCSVPTSTEGYRSLVDVLEAEQGYAVELYSEAPDILRKVFSDRRPVMGFTPWSTHMMEHALQETLLPQTDRRMLFFHFAGVDRIGHTSGFHSPNYNAQVYCVDYQIERLVRALSEWEPQHTTFVLISEHGGVSFEHDSFSLEAMQVPFAMWGDGICREVNLFSTSVNVLQVAPTILAALSYEQPSEWKHMPVSAAVCTDLKSTSAAAEAATHSDAPQVCPLPMGISHHETFRFGTVLLSILFVTGFLMLIVAIYGDDFLVDELSSLLRCYHS